MHISIYIYICSVYACVCDIFFGWSGLANHRFFLFFPSFLDFSTESATWAPPLVGQKLDTVSPHKMLVFSLAQIDIFCRKLRTF